MNLFLDTEWADAEGTQLVSLALVSEDGEHVFYAERDPLPANPTPFVRDVVYPLLDRANKALDDRLFTTRLRRFLARFETPCAIYEVSTDINLFKQAMAGFNLTGAEAAACGPAPNTLAMQIDDNGVIKMIVEDWFDSHSDARVMRHHARVDAQAFRMAWLAANSKIEPEWSRTWQVHRKTRSREDSGIDGHLPPLAGG
ncbi:MAG: hypothetical protein NVS9B2_29280 [Steroidobacteraceae bacterium]